MSTAMGDATVVACPQCHSLNRVPHGRLTQAPACGRCKQPLFDAHPVALDEVSFERHVMRAQLPVLVDFWAPWCAPCRMMAPHFEAAAAALEPAVRLVKVDTEAQPALGARFDIRGIPTLAIFRAGREIARRSGAIMTPEIVAWTRSHIASYASPLA